jgi:hypothetical protein
MAAGHLRRVAADQPVAVRPGWVSQGWRRFTAGGAAPAPGQNGAIPLRPTPVEQFADEPINKEAKTNDE